MDIFLFYFSAWLVGSGLGIIIMRLAFATTDLMREPFWWWVGGGMVVVGILLSPFVMGYPQ